MSQFWREVFRTYLAYLAAGAASIPGALVYAHAASNGAPDWQRWAGALLALAAGIVVHRFLVVLAQKKQGLEERRVAQIYETSLTLRVDWTGREAEWVELAVESLTRKYRAPAVRVQMMPQEMIDSGDETDGFVGVVSIDGEVLRLEPSVREASRATATLNTSHNHNYSPQVRYVA